MRSIILAAILSAAAQPAFAQDPTAESRALVEPAFAVFDSAARELGLADAGPLGPLIDQAAAAVPRLGSDDDRLWDTTVDVGVHTEWRGAAFRDAADCPIPEGSRLIAFRRVESSSGSGGQCLVRFDGATAAAFLSTARLERTGGGDPLRLEVVFDVAMAVQGDAAEAARRVTASEPGLVATAEAAADHALSLIERAED